LFEFAREIVFAARFAGLGFVEETGFVVRGVWEG